MMVDGDLEMEFWIEKDSEMIEWNGLGADEEAQLSWGRIRVRVPRIIPGDGLGGEWQVADVSGES